MRTHIKIIVRIAAALLVLLLCLPLAAGAAETGRYADYAEYNGCAFYEPGGQLRYWIEFGADGKSFYLHFVYPDGDRQVDDLYTLYPDWDASDADILKIGTVVDSGGNAVSHYFTNLEFRFSDDGSVLMVVERDGRTISGGTRYNILSGEYVLTPSDLVQPAPEGDPAEDMRELQPLAPGPLGSLAQRYYGLHFGYFPPEADITDNGDGTYLIHLYETTQNEDGTYHTASYAWYTVNATGSGIDEIMGTPIDLAK